MLDNGDTCFLSNIKRYKQVPEVTLHQAMNKEFKGFECYFKATIEEIENKRSGWYSSCKRCTSMVFPTAIEDKHKCSKCNNDDAKFIDRYMLKFRVSDGDNKVRITIFENSEILLGCSVSQYKNLIKVYEKREDCKYYKKLAEMKEKEYYFLIRLSNNDKEKTHLRAFIAVEIQEIDKVEKIINIEDEDGDEEIYWLIASPKADCRSGG
ncbi:uncharacterized protein LOC126655334 [Mercurialis annua]|uniref:uncharacterized protein LOC126655334 n=1 Tax=Mercurialis annua TaxID=3986 RepID=UPI0024AED0A6|nr:uncharacterized protein LOC126655334 [Mercurialis annua]